MAQRGAMMMVLMIGLHSLVEYPLWYSYFLLPAAWAWGFALQGFAGGGDDDRRPAVRATTRPEALASGHAAAAATAPTPTPGAAPSRALVVAALTLAAGAALSVPDYLRVADIFTASPGAPPLEQRIAAGQRSVFFAHHADYAAVTSGLPVADPARAFDRVTHYLLDTRLMIAWAQSLAARGEVDAARHVAARLREFRKADAEEFFAPCTDATETVLPQSRGAPLFPCVPPVRDLPWRWFRQAAEVPGL